MMKRTTNLMTKIRRRKAALPMYRSPRWGTECAEEKVGRPADGGQNTKARWSIFLKNSINLRYSSFRFSLKKIDEKVLQDILIFESRITLDDKADISLQMQFALKEFGNELYSCTYLLTTNNPA